MNDPSVLAGFFLDATFRDGITEHMALDAGWSSPVARQAHNLKVAGSNPAPATIVICTPSLLAWGCSFFGSVPSFSKAAMRYAPCVLALAKGWKLLSRHASGSEI